jgi:hypothetical protein
MLDSDERTSEEPLMLKEKIEEEDSEWTWSSEKQQPQTKRNLSFWMLTTVPWVLLTLLGTWDVIKYQKRHTKEIFNLGQQVYSAFLLAR